MAFRWQTLKSSRRGVRSLGRNPVMAQLRVIPRGKMRFRLEEREVKNLLIILISFIPKPYCASHESLTLRHKTQIGVTERDQNLKTTLDIDFINEPRSLLMCSTVI